MLDKVRVIMFLVCTVGEVSELFWVQPFVSNYNMLSNGQLQS